MSTELKLTPMGKQILILPIEDETYKTVGSGAILVGNTELVPAKIVELSQEFEDKYNVGDVILYARGVGTSQNYRGELHWWIDGRGTGDFSGQVWAIIEKQNTKKNA
jgi:hypothetical protein